MSDTVSDSSKNMQKYHDNFMASFMLLLNLLTTNGKKSVIEYSNKLLQGILNKEMTTDKQSALIRQIFFLLDTHNGLLKTNNVNLFSLQEKKNGKTVRKTVIPGIDIGASFSAFNTEDQKYVWTYLKSMYVSCVKMINIANNSNGNITTQNIVAEFESELDIKKINTEYWAKFPDSHVILKQEFNPYIGVGSSTNEYSLDDMLSGPEILPNQTAPISLTGSDGISNIVKMIGIDKMINMEELTNQLKNMTDEDIEKASQGIRQMLGEDADESTTEMIDSMLHNINSELKKEAINGTGDPISNVVKIANNVAQNMLPTIDQNKIDMEKMWDQTKKMTNKCVDKDGKPLFNGKDNPLSFMTSFMEKQINMYKGKTTGKTDTSDNMSEADYLKECQKMMAEMGMPNISPDQLKNLSVDQLVADLDKHKNASSSSSSSSSNSKSNSDNVSRSSSKKSAKKRV